MFKKTLLASAILATAFGANAATLTVVDGGNVSVQGTSATTKRVNLKTVNTTGTQLQFKLSQNLDVDDTLIFDFTGGVMLGAPILESSVSSTTKGTEYDLTATSKTVTVKVKDKSKFVANTVISLDELDFIADTIAAKDAIKVAATFRKSNGVINPDEAPVAAKAFATFFNQFEVKNKGSFDAMIDVANKRETFTGKATSDILKIEGNKAANAVNVNSVAITSATFELTPSTMAGIISAVNSGSVKGALSTDKSKYTWTYTGTDGIPSAETYTLGVETDAAKKAALAARTFNGKATYNFNADGKSQSVVLLNGSVGAWKLNGSSVTVPYMPYADTISQVIYLNNTGTVSGEVSVDYITDKGVKGNFTLPEMAKAGEVTAIAGSIKKGLEDDGFKTGKAKLDIVVNTPAGSISAFTGYNVGGNSRVVVANSTTHDLGQKIVGAIKTLTSADVTAAVPTATANANAFATANTNALNDARAKAAGAAVVTIPASGTDVTAAALAAANAVCNLSTATHVLYAGGVKVAAAQKIADINGKAFTCAAP